MVFYFKKSAYVLFLSYFTLKCSSKRSTLDRSGNRLSNFKKRLEEIFKNSHNEKLPFVIATKFGFYDSFRELRLELGLPVQEKLIAIKYNGLPVDLEANKSKPFKDR